MSEYRDSNEVIYNSDHSKFVNMECEKNMCITDIDAIHSKLGTPKNHYMLIESKHLNEPIRQRQLDTLRCLHMMFKKNSDIEYHGGFISFAKFSKENGFEVAYMCSIENLEKVYEIKNKNQYRAICEMKISPSKYNVVDMTVVRDGNKYTLKRR